MEKWGLTSHASVGWRGPVILLFEKLGIICEPGPRVLVCLRLPADRRKHQENLLRSWNQCYNFKKQFEEITLYNRVCIVGFWKKRKKGQRPIPED